MSGPTGKYRYVAEAIIQTAFILSVLALIILFGGEPDLMDALTDLVRRCQ